MDIVELVNKYGFPIVAAGGMGYLIYYVWKWATTEIKPVLGEAKYYTNCSNRSYSYVG